jgi:YihY family inner membrane protein
MASVLATARRADTREVLREVLRCYKRSDLLTYGSAIAFQVLFALIPLGLFGLGLLGFFGLEDVYSRDVVPNLRGAVSPDVFKVVDSTVRRALTAKQAFWITAGAAIAVWEMSGAMRAVMQVFDRIYGCERERSFRERYLVSIALAVAAGTLLLATVAVAQGGPLVLDGFLALLRWPVAIGLMVATVGLLVHYAPADPHPWRFVSVGTVLVVLSWTVTSLAFYVTQVADYGSVFGNLATVIVTFEYLYLAACAFLTGAVLDTIVRGQRA